MPGRDIYDHHCNCTWSVGHHRGAHPVILSIEHFRFLLWVMLLLGVRRQVSRDVKSRWLSLVESMCGILHPLSDATIENVRHPSSNPRHGQGRPTTWPIKSDPRNPAPRNCRGGVEPPARLVAPSCVPNMSLLLHGTCLSELLLLRV